MVYSRSKAGGFAGTGLSPCKGEGGSCEHETEMAV